MPKGLKFFILNEMRTHSKLMKDSYNISDAAYAASVAGMLQIVIDELHRHPEMLEGYADAIDELEELGRAVCFTGGSVERALGHRLGLKKHLK